MRFFHTAAKTSL